MTGSWGLWPQALILLLRSAQLHRPEQSGPGWRKIQACRMSSARPLSPPSAAWMPWGGQLFSSMTLFCLMSHSQQWSQSTTDRNHWNLTKMNLSSFKLFFSGILSLWQKANTLLESHIGRDFCIWSCFVPVKWNLTWKLTTGCKKTWPQSERNDRLPKILFKTLHQKIKTSLSVEISFLIVWKNVGQKLD